MKRAISPAAAAALIPDGATVMIGGFMGVGSPHRLIDAIVAADKRNLTVIANDTAMPGVGIGSYPQYAAGVDYRVRVTVEGLEQGAVDAAVAQLQRELPPGAVLRVE